MRKRRMPDALADSAAEPASANTLMRGLEVLRAFTAADATLGNQDLIDRTGLPKATISRLTWTLTSLGYLQYDESLGRYAIGPATIALGYNGLSANVVVRMARPLMRDLAERTGVAVALGMREGRDMVYMANWRPDSPVSLRLNVGARVPLLRTSMGLAWLVSQPQAEQEALVADLLAADPTRLAENRSLIERAREDMASRGFVSAFGIWFSYINALGTCFHPSDGSPSVGITCGGIQDLLPREKCLAEVGPLLVELKARLAAALAGESDPHPLAATAKKVETSFGIA